MKLYDTLSTEKREFTPNSDIVKMYVCGPNLYGPCHVGHALSYIYFDVDKKDKKLIKNSISLFEEMKNKFKSQKKIAIIGAGMGGISASIHLASRGFEVTIFEKNNSLGGRCNVIEEEGFKFDLGPSLLNYPWVFKELFKAAGENFENHIELLEVKSGVKFLWDNGEHFNISGD